MYRMSPFEIIVVVQCIQYRKHPDGGGEGGLQHEARLVLTAEVELTQVFYWQSMDG